MRTICERENNNNICHGMCGLLLLFRSNGQDIASWQLELGQRIQLWAIIRSEVQNHEKYNIFFTVMAGPNYLKVATQNVRDIIIFHCSLALISVIFNCSLLFSL